MADVIEECKSLNVAQVTRAVNVEALNSCSAYKISETSMALTCRSLGGWPLISQSTLPASERFALAGTGSWPLRSRWWAPIRTGI